MRRCLPYTKAMIRVNKSEIDWARKIEGFLHFPYTFTSLDRRQIRLIHHQRLTSPQISAGIHISRIYQQPFALLPGHRHTYPLLLAQSNMRPS